jgi:hypothetical protein
MRKASDKPLLALIILKAAEQSKREIISQLVRRVTP